ncbi:MAG: DNA mismatch repair protein MutS [Chloroherpetonaceae bacterium]|nr:DNA mismatch repair protein MutS [Chloroherpetonaceae bacterium]
MRQYEKIKSQYPNVVVLFRVGDFYETFNDDAKKVSAALGIVLTKRSNGAASEVPLAGFPHHSLDGYVEKLVRKGFRVAVCDQMEDPKFAKGIVKREITDIITPGVNFSDKLLSERKNNYLTALHFSYQKKETIVGVAFIDATTAEFQVSEIHLADLKDLLSTINPAEVLISKSEKARITEIKKFITESAFTELEDWRFQGDFARETLTTHFQTHSLKGFGIDGFQEGIIAAGVILGYLQETQRAKLSYIQKITPFDMGSVMSLDPQTKRNLELTATLQNGGREGSLLSVLDKTQTSMGARLFKKMIARPSKDLSLINSRLDAVRAFVGSKEIRTALCELMSNICDLERVFSRIATHRALPKEILAFYASTALVPKIKEILLNIPAEPFPELLKEIWDGLYEMKEIQDEIERALNPDASNSLGEGGVIKEGYSPELDEYRTLSSHAKDRLLEIQEEERVKTGIGSLKVLYNKVFGYYIEVSNANRAKVPDYYERKQTMVNAERFMIPALKEYEEKILNAAERIAELEVKLFQELRIKISKESGLILRNAASIALLDTLLSLATAAIEYDYVCPELHEGDELEIELGRHPVLERILPVGETYVPNSTLLNHQTRVMLITGPNMSGKSSYLRQTGLIVLLAQIGSFVPAARARVGIVDKIFTRVGASDNLAEGESTFLVEMNEAAAILNNATAKSLILLDEVGRGTSTYDGMSIAWAMTEYLHDVIGAKTLFATHYHELSELETQLSRLKNFHATVAESEGKVIFLRRIEKGAAESSFGIEVARMAGLPEQVISRAKEILGELESAEAAAFNDGDSSPSKGKKGKKAERFSKVKPKDDFYQISLFEIGDSKVKEALDKIDVNKLTPIEALLKLAEIKRLAEKL